MARYLYLCIALIFARCVLGSAVARNTTKRSLKLDPRALQNASFHNGHPTGNESASLTSHNNFVSIIWGAEDLSCRCTARLTLSNKPTPSPLIQVNFCISRHSMGATLMNGNQSPHNYSCNSIPMGMVGYVRSGYILLASGNQSVKCLFWPTFLPLSKYLVYRLSRPTKCHPVSLGTPIIFRNWKRVRHSRSSWRLRKWSPGDLWMRTKGNADQLIVDNQP
jgi:hypothetical protein